MTWGPYSVLIVIDEHLVGLGGTMLLRGCPRHPLVSSYSSHRNDYDLFVRAERSRWIILTVHCQI